MINPRVQLFHWKPLLHPYYQVEFHTPSNLLPAIAGDKVSLDMPTSNKTFSFPVMQADSKNKKLRCLFKAPSDYPATQIKEIFNPFKANHYFYIQNQNKQDNSKKVLLLLAQDEHLASLILHAESIQNRADSIFAVIEINHSLFFPAKPSNFIIQGIDPAVTAGVSLLEDWGIASRIACHGQRPGCYQGSAITVSQDWLSCLPHQENEIGINVYGDNEFIRASRQLWQAVQTNQEDLSEPGN